MAHSPNDLGILTGPEKKQLGFLEAYVDRELMEKFEGKPISIQCKLPVPDWMNMARVMPQLSKLYEDKGWMNVLVSRDSSGYVNIRLRPPEQLVFPSADYDDPEEFLIRRAFFLIDPINTFRDRDYDGQLKVTGADATIPGINKQARSPIYVVRAVSKEEHPDNHDDFCTSHNVPPFTVVNGRRKWPPHGRKGFESEFHPDLDLTVYNKIFVKGHRKFHHPYSGWAGVAGLKVVVNDGSLILGINEDPNSFFRRNRVTHIDFAGWAFDYCAGLSALHSQLFDYRTRILKWLTASVAPETEEQMMKLCQIMGVEVVEREEDLKD